MKIGKKKTKSKNIKKRRMLTRTVLLVSLSVLICLLFNPVFKNLKFGLDLQGGFEILYQVEPLDGSDMTKDKLLATYKSMLKRIDSLGVSEPEITLEGNDKIRVKLAGVTNREEASSTLSTVASLSFRDTEDNLLMSSDVLKAGGAKVTTDTSGKPAVLLSVEDKSTFYDVTNKVKNYEENVIVIWLDYNEMTDSYATEQNYCGSSSSHCLSAARVDQGFASDVVIQGDFTQEEAEDLVDLINSGSMPAQLTEISSKTVSASLGDETLQTTLIAGIIGVAAIIIMLVIVYHFAGLISAASILLYTLLVFAIFWLVGGVLTLPGIAALILGIGMAVDANVLTYARIKEELLKGRSLKTAFKNGSKLSFKTILDSNLTTLLVAIIMFIFGESSVKGFATMLIINIGVTMVTMVAITRAFMKMFIDCGYFDDKPNLFLHVSEDKIAREQEEKKTTKKTRNFLGYGKKVAIAASIIVVVGAIFLGVKGFNLGIDYQAGSDITIATDQVVGEDDLKDDIDSLGLEEVSTDMTSDEINIRVKDVLTKDQVNEVQQYFEDKYAASVDIGVVSNLVKQELVKNAVIAILISLLGIIAYVSIRFQFSFGLSSVICLVHDVLIMIAGLLIFQIEVNSMFIAAVLAIIGYSINNTIVVFDRVRENMEKKSLEKMTESDLQEVLNKSIGQTMARSIYTSLTTLLPIIALMILGSRELITFNVSMTIGLIAGTFSSVFLASFIWYHLTKKQLGKKTRAKKNSDEVSEKIIAGIND